jgi:hypothetical protein
MPSRERAYSSRLSYSKDMKTRMITSQRVLGHQPTVCRREVDLRGGCGEGECLIWMAEKFNQPGDWAAKGMVAHGAALPS